MERSHLGLLILSAIFAGSNGQAGVYCVDPHTNLHYPVNSTWPSSTFCGTYTCNAKHVSKDDGNGKFESIPILETTIDDSVANGEDIKTKTMPLKMFEEEENESSAKNLEGESSDYTKNIENVLKASKELTEISGEIQDIAKHVKLYKMANDLLKSLTKSENIEKLSDSDAEIVLQSITKHLNKNEKSNDDGLDTADTQTIYHNMNQIDYSKDFIPSPYSGPEVLKYPANDISKSLYDYNNLVSPYYSYYPSYMYRPPYHQHPYTNMMDRQRNYYSPNEDFDDSSINSSDLNETFEIPDDVRDDQEQMGTYPHRKPLASGNPLYSDQYIRYWTSKGYKFPNIPKISPIRNPSLFDHLDINTKQTISIGKTSTVKKGRYDLEKGDSHEHLKYDNHYHHHHHAEKAPESYQTEKSTHSNNNGHHHNHDGSHPTKTNEGHHYKYYPYNYNGHNHKLDDNKANIAYYYYDPVKNEYTLDVPRNYTEYEKYYRNYMKNYPDAALPINSDSILDLDQYYNTFSNGKVTGYDQAGIYDIHQSHTHVQEVSRMPEDQTDTEDNLKNNLYGSLQKNAMGFIDPTDSEKVSDSVEPNDYPSYKYTNTDSEDFKIPEDAIQWQPHHQHSHLSNSPDKKVNDFTLRMASQQSESSEEPLTRINSNSNVLTGTQRSNTLFKPLPLLNLSPLANLKSQRYLRRISKRSLDDHNEMSHQVRDRKWRSYITVQGCPETLEPGYFKSGDESKHYPLCCPQKIAR